MEAPNYTTACAPAQESEALQAELREALARQPGAATADALLEAQAAVRARSKQVKALTSELGMYRAQVRGPAVMPRGKSRRPRPCCTAPVLPASAALQPRHV